MAFEPITAENLRIGLHVKIEGSWFSHPFPSNTFKIKASKDLQTIRELQKVKLLYDPERSDPEGQVNEEDSPEMGSGSLNEGSTPEKDPIQYKRDLQKDHQKYQEHLRKVEEEYKKSLRQGKTMFQDLSSGSARGMAAAQEIVGRLNGILVDGETSKAMMHLMGSNETGEEFLLHTLNVCTLSILIARELGFKKHEIEKIAMGAMLHDLGELKYTREMLFKKTIPSSAETKAILKKHPKYGKEMLTSFPNFPYECLDIVDQHHERIDGSGYPLGLKGGGITQYAKIVMVADEYDELCNHPDPIKSLTPSEALSHIYSKQQGGLWNDATITLIRLLGVFPPGALVMLSDDSIGLVTSISIETSLRPIVMIYSEDIPKEEAIIVNLAQMKDLSIQKAIRPTELSPQMRDYLNPRRVISYYPSTPEPEEITEQVETVLAQA